MTATGIGKPGRHSATGGYLGDRHCVFSRLLIRQQRKWRNLPGSVAALTMLLQNGSYVFVEGGIAGESVLNEQNDE